MELKKLILKLEAMIFASDRPLPFIDILSILNENITDEKEQTLDFEVNIPHEDVKMALDAIIEKYKAEFYPFEMKLTGGGYCFLTKQEFHPVVAKVCQEKKVKKLSTAAMETLAIIAYKQPITKSDIEFLRGVSSDYSIQKLLEKELIIISGRKEDAVGKPLLYKTSNSFIDYLGIQSFTELPKIEEIVDVNLILANKINSENGSTTFEVVEGSAIEEELIEENE